MNRRYFIKSGGIALASFGLMTATPTFLRRALAETIDQVTGGRRKTLIAIFQRGAVDGLNVVVPYGEHSYYDLRPSIAIPKPNGGAEAAINLDGFFGLHPAMAPFKPLWDSKRLAIVHASGSPDNTRSHFDAQDYMESATPGVKSTVDGWLNRLLQIAQLIKAGVGLEVAFTDIGGWDTHVNEGNQQGQLSNLLRQFSSAIAALYADLGQRMDDVVVLTMSEFGRTAKENGNRGTDHGHANAMFIVGNSVRGGKVYGDWPGMKNEQLYEGRDLALTTDFRDVFSEVAARHLGATNLKAVFPGYTGSSSKFRGFLG